jgi:hypothetical protein
MFVSILTEINRAIVQFIIEDLNVAHFKTGLEESVQIAYEHYVIWLKHNKELRIGAHKLSNEQLFWVALAVCNYNKYHSTITNDINSFQRLQIEFMHFDFKSRRGFQESFSCTMQNEEKVKFLDIFKDFY